MTPATIDERRTFTAQRVTTLLEALEAFDVTDDRLRQTCVYATGSIGRGEATEHSDLDVFLLDLGDATASDAARRPLRHTEQILVKADIIRATGEARFEPFSGDAEWLTVHTVDDMLARLGTRDDDARNLFTARLLMLLEGAPLVNHGVYDAAMSRVLDRYWRDYKAHPDDFIPVMLANDIVRFWKTLTLNYEAKRNAGPPAGDEGEWRAKRRLDLFKLGFSRLWICQSAITFLVWLSTKGPVTTDDALAMFKLTPSQRLEHLAEAEPAVARLVRDILAGYAWFLDKTDAPKDDLLRWISDDTERDHARRVEREFGDRMHQLITQLNGDGPLLRYLVV